MSEPITLYRGEEVMTVYAPSEAQRLIAEEGWRNEQGQETEGQGQAERDAQGWQEGGQEVVVTPVTRRAGRPKKAQ